MDYPIEELYGSYFYIVVLNLLVILEQYYLYNQSGQNLL